MVKLSVGCVAALLAVGMGLAQTPDASVSYTRLVKGKDGVETLQTEAKRFVPADGKGPIVWLVGAAHVGEPGYYGSMQKLLDQQGVVLYEAVTRNGVDPTKAARENAASPTPKPTIYGLFADTLGLTQQLEAIDYTRPAFHRSDLSWEELSALAEKGGKESTTGLTAVAQALDPNSAQGKLLTNFLGTVKSDPGSREGLRLAMTEGLAQAGKVAAKALSPAQGELILKARNDKVASDLQAIVKSPEAPRSVALFYGAAHMPDLESRVLAMGYQPSETRWYSAISADENKVNATGKTLLTTFRAMFARLGGR